MLKKSNKNIHAVKGFLAKILAKENIAIRHDPTLSTASFNVKERVLYFPMWENISDDVYDMLVVHEVGHALETPWEKTEALFKRVYKEHGNGRSENAVIRSFHGFFNVVEDVRIDQIQRKRYPGSKKNYINGYREMYEKDFFGTKNNPPSKMMFIDRLNLYSKAGFSGIHVPFTAAEKKNVDRAMACKTFEEAADLAIEFWLAEQSAPTHSLEFSWENLLGELEGEFTDDETPENGKEKAVGHNPLEKDPWVSDDPIGEAEKEKEDKKDAAEDESDSEEDEEEDEDDGTPKDGGRRSEQIFNPSAEIEKKKAQEQELPVSDTEKSFSDGVSALAPKRRKPLTYLNVPVAAPDWQSRIIDHKLWLNYHRKVGPVPSAKNAVRKFLASEKTNISYMIKEFEARKRARDYTKTQVSKTGVINTNKLHSYMFSEDIFRRNEVVPKGKNHGFVLFIDVSGSMNSTIHNVVKQALSIVTFCRRLQIPYEVFTFTDGSISEKIRNARPGIGNDHFLEDNNALAIGGYFRINNVLSSRMNAVDHEAATAYLWAVSDGGHGYLDGMAGTPLNETVVLSSAIINAFKKANKVDIVSAIYLTDGEGSWINNASASGDYILFDPESKEYVPVPEVDYVNRRFVWTNVLLEVVKARTGANMIGFYVFDGRIDPYVIGQGRYEKSDLYNKSKKMLSSEGFCKIENSGYDDYFYIRGKTLEVDQTSIADAKLPDKIQGNITSKNFASFLKKHMDNKATSRVLLSDFIKRIA